MLFSSIEFLLLFLPITYGINFLLPKKLRNYWLLIASLFFYAWGEPRFVFVMMASICFNYLLARWIEHYRENKKAAKAILILDVALNLGILVIFKYLNFITVTVHSWLPASRAWFPETSIALPIGISFFTFQALSYVVDVYRGIDAQKNPAYLGLYIALFPQLIAGPIVRYTTVMDQINERHITADDFKKGIMRFLLGFNKKILLANVLSEVADMAFASGDNTVCMAWMGALCYGLQLYFDFDGYSDMAIPAGRIESQTRQGSSEPVYRLVPHRPLARGELDLYPLGHPVRSGDDRGENVANPETARRRTPGNPRALCRGDPGVSLHRVGNFPICEPAGGRKLSENHVRFFRTCVCRCMVPVLAERIRGVYHYRNPLLHADFQSDCGKTQAWKNAGGRMGKRSGLRDSVCPFPDFLQLPGYAGEQSVYLFQFLRDRGTV